MILKQDFNDKFLKSLFLKYLLPLSFLQCPKPKGANPAAAPHPGRQSGAVGERGRDAVATEQGVQLLGGHRHESHLYV